MNMSMNMNMHMNMSMNMNMNMNMKLKSPKHFLTTHEGTEVAKTFFLRIRVEAEVAKAIF